MFPESSHEWSVVRPNFKFGYACEIVMTLLYRVYDGLTLQLDRAVSRLRWRQGCAAALNQCQFVFVHLDQGEADAV